MSECSDCSFRGACRDSKMSWAFFFIGLIATVAMRVIEPLRMVNPDYGRISWYVGVTGFFLFFVYKYMGSLENARVISETGLKAKLASGVALGERENRVLLELICSQDNKKEQINYFAIFSLSLLALAVALWADIS